MSYYTIIIKPDSLIFTDSAMGKNINPILLADYNEACSSSGRHWSIFFTITSYPINPLIMHVHKLLSQQMACINI